MERILIIGSNGAGKTTFATALSEKRGLPLIHLDQIYWRGCWEVTPPEEFSAMVLQEAQKPCWIIEGNNIKTLNQRLPFADCVFWFEFSPAVCLCNILKRELRYLGRARPDMPEGCISHLSIKFLIYAWNFNRSNRERIQAELDAAKVKVIRFTNRRQVKAYLEGDLRAP